MDKRSVPARLKILFLPVFLIPGLLAGCTLRVYTGSGQRELNLGPAPTTQLTYTPYPTYTPRPTYTPLPLYTPRPTYTFLPLQAVTGLSALVPAPGEISQFAKGATASSQYSQPKWSAMQATGAPDTTACGDFPTAWASLKANGKDWLLLTYARAVIPVRIVIYQTYHPGAVSRVEVLDAAGNATPVYTATPAVVSQCPSLLQVEMKDMDVPVSSVRVILDQSNHDGWSEIDAVQLIGRPK
jgi:hypothetical protein